MKSLTQISVIVAFLFAAFISTQVPALDRVAASDNENNGSSAGYEFEEVETAQNDQDRSKGYEFEEVETAQNDQDRSNGYEFEEVETA